MFNNQKSLISKSTLHTMNHNNTNNFDDHIVDKYNNNKNQD